MAAVQPVTANVAPPVVQPVEQTVVPPATALVTTHDEPLAEAGLAVDRAPAAPSAERLLSEVSTMDLMMPMADPNLDITSRHSLWAQVGKAYDIDPLLLYSVALVESKSLYPDGKVAPTPWLFRVDDHLVRGDRQHVQLQMAAASQFGSAVQDVGIMQVYYPMHRDAVRDPLILLDPRTNITVAAKILRDGMHRTRDRVMGVGYYHSRTPSLAKGYGTAVLTVYERLKAERRIARRHKPVAR
ncbi:transglycosylase SLT domain-containing protein [Rhodanobacter sp. AS-Z3]|uniref:transglycosylase SLT domain-containing protein n=1 Tax=Rhodanobacter sp. AS-Z3 TaxID=3031330 RepID=UPI0024793AA3|nr:transglycosylase SLT domain-containing protein [Rhodanobacter sp. AS-Z3]WEN14170.1 transglycosylase SLT domain-containing protein [Rhodanobacter sp. AS-Z3]